MSLPTHYIPHLAEALQFSEAQRGFRQPRHSGSAGHLIFTTVAALVNELVEASHNSQLSRALARWKKWDLIALDEMGYVPLAEVGAEMLFQVIANRAEKAAVIITTKCRFPSGHRSSPTPASARRCWSRAVICNQESQCDPSHKDDLVKKRRKLTAGEYVKVPAELYDGGCFEPFIPPVSVSPAPTPAPKPKPRKTLGSICDKNMRAAGYLGPLSTFGIYLARGDSVRRLGNSRIISGSC